MKESFSAVFFFTALVLFSSAALISLIGFIRNRICQKELSKFDGEENNPHFSLWFWLRRPEMENNRKMSYILMLVFLACFGLAGLAAFLLILI